MSYELTWKAGASRDMDRLPLAIASAVVEFIYGPLAQNPRRVGKPLRFEGGNGRLWCRVLKYRRALTRSLASLRNRRHQSRAQAGRAGYLASGLHRPASAVDPFLRSAGLVERGGHPVGHLGQL